MVGLNAIVMFFLLQYHTISCKPLALKGHHIPAQGNALGFNPLPIIALKGCDKTLTTPMLRPYRAFWDVYSFPRALPWAGMFNPFGVITERWIFDITIVNLLGCT